MTSYWNIQKQVEELRKLAEDTKKVLNQLLPGVGVAAVVLNNTDEELARSFHQQDKGEFARVPPISIRPRTQAGFASAGDDIPIPFGAVGSVHYTAPDLLVKWDWNNPLLGSNTAITQIEDRSGRYSAWSDIGGGNTAQAELGLSELPSDDGWRSCRRCLSLYRHGWAQRAPVCLPVQKLVGIAFGQHDPSGSYDYVVTYQTHQAVLQADERDGQQLGWRLCEKCNGLFYDQFEKKGICNGDWGLDTTSGRIINQGYGHQADPATPVYRLPYNYAPTPGRRAQAAWRWCDKCYGLAFSGFDQPGPCPAGQHHHVQSYEYVLNHR